MEQTDSTSRPLTTDFMFYEDILSTFKNWPKQMSQKQSDLAKSGFYYTGENDVVKCYSCKIKLHEWEVNDIPMREHLKWSPNCVFLNMIGPKCLGFVTSQPTKSCGCLVLETPSSIQNSFTNSSLQSTQSISKPQQQTSGVIFGNNTQDTGLTTSLGFQTAGQKRLSDFQVEPHHFVKHPRTSGFGFGGL